MSKSSRGGMKVFFITLIISFVLLMCIFLAILLIGSADTTKQVDLAQVPYVPSVQENINVLVFSCEQTNLPPTTMTLVCYDAQNATLGIVNVPTSLAINDKTMLEWYDYEGIRGGVRATEDFLQCDIERYVRVNSDGLTTLVDFSGGINFDLPAAITCKEVAFTQGKQLLDGRRYAALAFGSPFSVDLINQYWAQVFTSELADKFDRFLLAIFNSCETNLNQYDFAVRQRAVMESLQQNTISINKYNLNNMDSINQVRELLKKE